MKKICYLLESSNLYGGVRIVFDQYHALKKLGYDVSIRARQGDHNWYPRKLSIEYTDDLAADWPDHHKPDVIIATFWTTVSAALKIKAELTLHLCQGYEGDISEYQPIVQQIENAYREKIQKITVSSWLKNHLETLYQNQFKVTNIGQIVDTDLFYPTYKSLIKKILRRILKKSIKILIVGSFSSKIKGINDALRGVQYAREHGIKIVLIRVATEPLSSEENKSTHIDFYLENLPPQALADLYRSVDLLIMPSHDGEGFGLPLAEAMACGTPCIATKIQAFLGFSPEKNYALFVPPTDPKAIGNGIIYLKDALLSNFKLRYYGSHLVHRQFKASSVAKKIANLIENQN